MRFDKREQGVEEREGAGGIGGIGGRRAEEGRDR